MALTRRQVLAGAAGVAGLALAGKVTPASALRLPARPPSAVGQLRDITLRAAARTAQPLGSEGPAMEIWGFDDALFPVIRLQAGDRLRATLQNDLAEHTSIHWHGVRVPNAMDGVQYLTQPPVQPGERFVYDFTPPDTGTFFFHPHCNESGQTGRGMAGVLIVEGDQTRPVDLDAVVVVKDWRLDENGRYLPFVTDKGASRAGTFGTVRAVNGARALTLDAPAGGLVRLRLLNLDSTRVIEVGTESGTAAIIATDGHALPPLMLDDTGAKTWRMGPAMRLDLLVAAPAPGETLRLLDYFSAEPWPIVTLRGAGPDLKRAFDPVILSEPAIPVPDLAQAQRMAFNFSAATTPVTAVADGLPEGDPLRQVLLDSICVQDKTFWAINNISWSSADHRTLPPPLGLLRAGASWIFEFQNTTPHNHPIHLHGHTFFVLSSTRPGVLPHLADTVLVAPKERLTIAFVAAPGDWMLHCHILEHLEYGMMGFLRVA